MLRLLCVATFLALAKCDTEDLKTFEGLWTNVKVYPDMPFNFEASCAPVAIELTTEHCKLGKNKIPVFKVTISPGSVIKIPVVIMDTEENDVEEAFAPKFVCKNSKVDTDTLFAFRYLSENYFLIYKSDSGPEMAMLFAKDVPTEKELEDYERNSSVLSDEEGSILCTKDKETGNKKMSNKFAANKDTATTNWMSYRPIKTTTEKSN